MMKFDLQLFAAEFDIVISGVASPSGNTNLALAANKMLTATLTNTSITTATLADLTDTNTTAVAYAIENAGTVSGLKLKLADVTATSVTFVAGLSGVTIKEGTAGEFDGLTFSSGDTTSFAVEAPTGTAIGNATSITFSGTTSDAVANATNLVMASGATVAFATESTSVTVKDSTEGNTLTVTGTLNLVNDSIATTGAVTGMANGASVSGLASNATATNGTLTAGQYITVNNTAYESAKGSAAGTITVTSTGASSSKLTAGVVSIDTDTTDGTANTSVIVGDDTISISGTDASATVTVATNVVTNITDLTAGATLTGVPANKTVMTATHAAKDEFNVNGGKFIAATGGTANLTIKALASGGELQNGTVYLTADSSDASSVTVNNGANSHKITATNGDVTVDIASGTGAVAIGDLDNGDTITIDGDTYSVVNGVFTHTAGSNTPTMPTAVTNTLTSTTAGNYVLTASFTAGAPTTLTLTNTTANVAINGVLSTGTEMDATVAGAAVSLGYGTDTTSINLTQIVDNAYVHQDGTITTTAKTGDLATVSYDATNEVVNYNASSSAKYQTINLGADTNVWNVTGTEYGDIIVGNTGGEESTLSGGSGKDIITAAEKNVAIGGAGADSIVAGAGANSVANAASMTGGADADVFDVALGSRYAVVTDFNLADGDVVSVAAGQAAVTKANALANFGVEGDATLGTSRVSLQSADGFYTARLKDTTDTRIVAWVGENATAIDNSGTNFKNVIFKGTGNDKGDVLTGGTGNDTFLGGIGDSIIGGAGNDSISLTAKTSTNEEVGRYVAISSTSGKDTVDGFTAAFDTVDGDWLGVTDGASTDIVITTAAKKSAAGNVTVKSGNGSVVLNSVSASTDTGAVELNINGAKVATIAEGTIATIGSADYAQYYIGTKGTSKKSGANLSNVTGDLMVDLSQTETIRNIDTLVGGAGNTTLMGSTSADSLVAGEGRTSLWGGASGSDTLVSGADATSFFYGTGSGKDTVVGFQTADVDASDVLTFIGGGFGNISRTNANTFEVKMSSGEKLTVNQSVSGADKAVNWQLMDGTASGVAKIALANNKLTYDNTVTNYFGTSSKDTVSVASSADNVSIWLDGSQGVSYSSIEIVDAKSSTGNATLAGGSGAETIYGGQGASSLWGGADTSNDVLVGSGKGTAMFFYGLGQGNDVINATTKDDTVNLYGVKLSDITATAVDSTKVTITTTANETLTVNGSVTKFTTGDGQTFYADHKNKTWSTTAV